MHESRPVALTSHIKKTPERVLLRLHYALDPLRFASKELVWVDHVAHPYLDEPRLHVLWFFKLRQAQTGTGVDPCCILDCWLPDKMPVQYIRLGRDSNGQHWGSTGDCSGSIPVHSVCSWLEIQLLPHVSGKSRRDEGLAMVFSEWEQKPNSHLTE